MRGNKTTEEDRGTVTEIILDLKLRRKEYKHTYKTRHPDKIREEQRRYYQKHRAKPSKDVKMYADYLKDEAERRKKKLPPVVSSSK